MMKKICRKCSVIAETDASKCPNCGASYKKGLGCLGWIVVSILVFMILGVFGSLMESAENESKKYTQVNTTNNVAVNNNAPVISKISWPEIDEIYNISSKYSDLQKDKLWEQYKDQYVQWTGIVSNISSSMDNDINLQVKMNPSTFTSDLLIDISKDQENIALQYKEGDKIVFVGKLRSWGSILPITLSEGRIIEEKN